MATNTIVTKRQFEERKVALYSCFSLLLFLYGCIELKYIWAPGNEIFQIPWLFLSCIDGRKYILQLSLPMKNPYFETYFWSFFTGIVFNAMLFCETNYSIIDKILFCKNSDRWWSGYCISKNLKELFMNCYWVVCNKFAFNTTECRVLSYSKRRYSILYAYVVGEEFLGCVQITDLGILFNYRPSLNLLIQNIVGQAAQTLWFIFRCWGQLRNISSVKFLYSSVFALYQGLNMLLLSGNFFYGFYISFIEKIQKRFFYHFFFKQHLSYR